MSKQEIETEKFPLVIAYEMIWNFRDILPKHIKDLPVQWKLKIIAERNERSK